MDGLTYLDASAIVKLVVEELDSPALATPSGTGLVASPAPSRS